MSQFFGNATWLGGGASLTEKGVTMLNDDINSDSITESATPNAVRKALEEAKKYTDEQAVNQSTIIFGVRGKVVNGRFTEEFFPVPYNIKILSAIATIVTPSAETLSLNIESTRNFSDYNKVLPTNITIAPGQNTAFLDINSEILFSRGDVLFLNVEEYVQDASDLVVNLIIEKI